MTDLFAEREKCTLHKQFELEIVKISFEIRIGLSLVYTLKGRKWISKL